MTRLASTRNAEILAPNTRTLVATMLNAMCACIVQSALARMASLAMLKVFAIKVSQLFIIKNNYKI
jgi:hypothetical protein